MSGALLPWAKDPRSLQGRVASAAAGSAHPSQEARACVSVRGRHAQPPPSPARLCRALHGGAGPPPESGRCCAGPAVWYARRSRESLVLPGPRRGGGLQAFGNAGAVPSQDPIIEGRPCASAPCARRHLCVPRGPALYCWIRGAAGEQLAACTGPCQSMRPARALSRRPAQGDAGGGARGPAGGARQARGRPSRPVAQNRLLLSRQGLRRRARAPNPSPLHPPHRCHASGRSAEAARGNPE